MAEAWQGVVGPPGPQRGERLAGVVRRLVRQYGPQGVAVLTPTPEHAAAGRERLQGSGRHRLSPQVLCLTEFADRLLEAEGWLRPAPRAAQRRWMVAAVVAATPLEYFARVARKKGFIAALEGTIAELQLAGVTPERLAALLTPEEGDRPLRELALLYQAYCRQQEEFQLWDEPQRWRRAAELWAQGRRGPWTGLQAVLLAGWREVPPAAMPLLQAVRAEVAAAWYEAAAITECGRPIEGLAVLATAARRKGRRLPQLTPATPPQLHRIEAAGSLGEARLVARAVRTLLDQGIPAARILLTARQIDAPLAQLYRDVCDEYGVPLEVSLHPPLRQQPAIAFLLAALDLPGTAPETAWSFGPLTAILRHSYFRPAWPERPHGPDWPLQAELVLRRLGVPRGQNAIRDALRRAAHPPPPTPDYGEETPPPDPLLAEQAARCLPLLEWMFETWGILEQPAAPLPEWVERLRQLAEAIGLAPSQLDPADRAALEQLWRELDGLTPLLGEKPLPWPEVLAIVDLTVAVTPQIVTPQQDAFVRLVPAELVPSVPCDYLFVLQLTEGSWPLLQSAASLLTEEQRERLRRAGLSLPRLSQRYDAERLLFEQVLAAPRVRLTVSYAAIGSGGEPQLPAAFLEEWLARQPPERVQLTRQTMLLDGYFTAAALSEAERRVQQGRALAQGQLPQEVTSETPPWLPTLLRTRELAAARYADRRFTPFDGLLSHPFLLQQLTQKFSPEYRFSPTALEIYVACPFRYFLQQVVGLHPLNDPSEEIEHTRRGIAIHETLARFHRLLRERDLGPERLWRTPDQFRELLHQTIDAVVREHQHQAVSPLTQRLWELEGRRLQRWAERYLHQWRRFCEEQAIGGRLPQPAYFEWDFGQAGREVELAAAEGTVRLCGRIDRLDLLEHDGGCFFWLIDYKTGRRAAYGQRQVRELTRLQLPLYAAAAQELLRREGRHAVPQGLVYWFVGRDGARSMWRNGSPDAGEGPPDAGEEASLPDGGEEAGRPAGQGWARLGERLQVFVAQIVSNIRRGVFPLQPDDPHCTASCPYGTVCRISSSRAVVTEWKEPLRVRPPEANAASAAADQSSPTRAATTRAQSPAPQVDPPAEKPATRAQSPAPQVDPPAGAAAGGTAGGPPGPAGAARRSAGGGRRPSRR